MMVIVANKEDKKMLKKIDERIKELCIEKNHSKYDSKYCPYCDEWEKLVLERNKLFNRIFYGR